MSKKTFVLSLVLVSALAFSTWLIRKSITEEQTTAHNSTDTPDAFMVNATYVRMDQNGNIHNKIFVSRMEHYAANDTSDFTNPEVMIYGQDQMPWKVTANYGQSESGIEEVHLWDNVKIHQSAGTNNNELTITTNSLTIFPQEQSAATNQPITIAQPGTVVNSVGLKANLQKGEVQLLSQAKGTYKSGEQKTATSTMIIPNSQ